MNSIYSILRPVAEDTGLVRQNQQSIAKDAPKPDVQALKYPSNDKISEMIAQVQELSQNGSIVERGSIVNILA